MKILRLNLKIFFLFLFINTNLSSEIIFDAKNMEVKNQGNLIIGFNSETKIPEKQINIKSDKAIYDKITNEVIFLNNVIFEDYINEVIIYGEKIIYKTIDEIVFSEVETKTKISDKYDITSNSIYFDRLKNSLYSNEYTIIKDNLNNKYEFEEKFKYDLENEIIKSNLSTITDSNNNKFIFEDLIINLKNNEIIGKELKIDFINNYFGNENNDPKMRGRSAILNKNITEVHKAVFSTCNINNKKCRGWELTSNEFIHNKDDKIFEYKNSWLKILDKKLFYLPYFNHPDPSVKRKSGFLTPSYGSSKKLGTSINIPYYKVISHDKDLTFNPRIYADKSYLLQNEYRQSLENSKITSDFSMLIGSEGTKSHFFYNQVGSLNEKIDFVLNLQDVKDDNFLKTHKLSETSPLIKSESLLNSKLDLNWRIDNKTKLNSSILIYEDLSKGYHDRYQYIFPNFNFSKNIDINKKYNGSFDFRSYGFHKNYNTNVTEAIYNNDFLFSSFDFINKNGIVTNYDVLLKNTNIYSQNSLNFNENTEYNLYGIVKIDGSYPLQKKMDQYTNFLKPKMSFRYSPNGNRNITSKDIRLNYDNVYSLNRIGSNYQVEGGESLTLGLEFQRENNNNGRIFDLNLANVIKIKKSNDLPVKSKLNETRSDIFGNMNLSLNNNLGLGYVFSYDRDLKYSNLEGINIDLRVNNFISNFYYFTEDNDFGNSENITNKTSYALNEENFLSFKTSKDLVDNFTQFYDLNYEYLTDCLSISLNYSKSFYKDGNLEPNTSLSFLIKIIPFTEIGVANSILK